jgi:dihydroorotate dehydrogenase (fumarate)
MISTTIAGIPFKSPIWNAAGAWCVTEAELNDLGKSAAGAITTKSCTKEFREGNPEPRYSTLPHGSINSSGLPNLGYKKYIEILPALKTQGKPIILSVSGLSLADNLEIVNAANDSEADIIELNLSCPNIVGKPQVGYDFEQMDRVLKEVIAVCNKPLGIKLPPYFDNVHFEMAANVIGKYPVKYLNCINSLGNGLAVDAETEKAMIKPKGGLGGIGGAYVKPTALANVRAFYTLLGGKMQIIGTGGVVSGKDAFEHILCGASGVQVATTLVEEGPGCFERLNNELISIMDQKGYKTLEDFRGKLKEL